MEVGSPQPAVLRPPSSFLYVPHTMITNDQELNTTQERIVQFQRWLAQMRRTARPEEFDAMASGYRLEIERMQAEVMEYLVHPLSIEPRPQPA
jgi:hypothetical protein